MSPDRCDVTRPWRSMRGVPFGCRMIARNWYRVLKASIANTFPEKSSSLRGSRTTISERLIPIGRRKGCSTQVPFDRGRALGVLWLSRVTRLHREFRFRSDTKGLELSDEHKRRLPEPSCDPLGERDDDRPGQPRRRDRLRE